jgi:hypothetical protein
MGQFNIAEVEGLEVLSLANNSVDYLSTNEKEQPTNSKTQDSSFPE